MWRTLKSCQALVTKRKRRAISEVSFMRGPPLNHYMGLSVEHEQPLSLRVDELLWEKYQVSRSLGEWTEEVSRSPGSYPQPCEEAEAPTHSSSWPPPQSAVLLFRAIGASEMLCGWLWGLTDSRCNYASTISNTWGWGKSGGWGGPIFAPSWILLT